MTKKVYMDKLTYFFQDEYHKLVNFVRKRINDTSDRNAEDVVQDVFLHLFDKADITTPIDNFAGYIYRSLRNKIIDLFRRKETNISLETNGSDKTSFSIKDILRDERVDIVGEAEKEELHHILYEAIDKLEPKDKVIIIATEFEDYSFKELAQEWDEPLGTLLARKSRALKKLRNFLKDSIKHYLEV